MKTPTLKFKILLLLVIIIAGFNVGASNVKAFYPLLTDWQYEGSTASIGIQFNTSSHWNVGTRLRPIENHILEAVAFWLEREGTPTQNVELKIYEDMEEYRVSDLITEPDHFRILAGGRAWSDEVSGDGLPNITIASMSVTSTTASKSTFHLGTYPTLNAHHTYVFSLTTDNSTSPVNGYTARYKYGSLGQYSKAYGGFEESTERPGPSAPDTYMMFRSQLYASDEPTFLYGSTQSNATYDTMTSGSADSYCDTTNSYWTPLCRIMFWLIVPVDTGIEFLDDSNVENKFPFSVIAEVKAGMDTLYETVGTSSSSLQMTMHLDFDSASNSHNFNVGSASFTYLDTSILPTYFGTGIETVRSAFVTILYVMFGLTAFYALIRAF